MSEHVLSHASSAYNRFDFEAEECYANSYSKVYLISICITKQRCREYLHVLLCRVAVK